MRINKIWVSKYKNIENLTLDFTNKNHLITLLVGQNGLGKSNLIEILALIFRDLDLIKTEEDFVNWSYLQNHFEYEIEYHCKGKEIIINCYEGKFEVLTCKGRKKETIDISLFIRTKSNDFLPDYVIGYYSGENKRVRDIIRIHEDLQIKYLKKWQRKPLKKKREKGLRRLFFSESAHSQLVLLTLAVYQHVPSYEKQVRQLLKKYLKVRSIEKFSITFRSPNWYKPRGRNDGIDHLISNLVFSTEGHQVDYPFWGLKGKIDTLLTIIYNIHIESHEPKMYPENERGRAVEIIDFDDISLVKFAQSIKDKFIHPVDLFYALESAFLIDSIKSIRIQVLKVGQGENFGFEQLSEGEQQLLTTLGLILITGKDDCLLLLDEPDTHLNPSWQRDYVDLLKEFDLNGGQSHMIVATHSPLIVQSSNEANVVLFYQNPKQKIKAEVSEIPFHTWRTDHVLTSPYFGLESARPKNDRLDTYMSERERILRKEKISKKDEESLRAYEDDFGLLPIGETFSDLEAMNLIRTKSKDK